MAVTRETGVRLVKGVQSRAAAGDARLGSEVSRTVGYAGGIERRTAASLRAAQDLRIVRNRSWPKESNQLAILGDNM